MCINSELKEICLKLATNGRSGKGFLLTSKVCPQGVFCLCRGAIYMYKIIKNVYKIRFRRDHFWNLQHMGKEKRPFYCHKIFVPNGLSAPAWGYTHVEKKHLKTIKKKTSRRFFLKLSTNGQSDKEFLLTSNFVPKGLYTCIKSFKMCLKSYFKEIVLKLATNGQSDKGFLLTSTFVPKGLSAPALGLYTCIKALKYIPGLGVRWVFTGPLVLWFFAKQSIINV